MGRPSRTARVSRPAGGGGAPRSGASQKFSCFPLRPLALAILAAALPAARAAFRHAEDYRVSIINEITGIAPPVLHGAAAADGRPPAHTHRRHRGRDPLGAEVSSSYDARPRAEVVVLDQHEGVLGVDCAAAGRPAGTLALHVVSARAFLDRLPAHAPAIFVVGAGWGCVGRLEGIGGTGAGATSGGGGDGAAAAPGASAPLGVPAGHEGIAALEPDGATIYARVVDLADTRPAPAPAAGDILEFDVTEVGVMDAFHSASVAYTRRLDPDVALRRSAAALRAAAAAAANATTYANATSGSGGGRRLTWMAAYEGVRLDDDSEGAAFAPGLTPHSRGRRRLEAATRALQGSHTVTNQATGIIPCALTYDIAGSFGWSYQCVWGE